MRSHPYSPGRRNPEPTPMIDLVAQAREQKAATKAYDKMTPYQRAKQSMKRKHKSDKAL